MDARDIFCPVVQDGRDYGSDILMLSVSKRLSIKV